MVKANKPSINASKTNLMVLGTPHMTSTKAREELNIMLDNMALEGVKFTKISWHAYRWLPDMEKSHKLHIQNYIKKYWCHEQA